MSFIFWLVFSARFFSHHSMSVALRVGAWIETGNITIAVAKIFWVALRVGAWIETVAQRSCRTFGTSSHSVWVRGLKQLCSAIIFMFIIVALRVGAWIETIKCSKCRKLFLVALRVGAWIETYYLALGIEAGTPSHSVWVRGLKQVQPQ